MDPRFNQKLRLRRCSFDRVAHASHREADRIRLAHQVEAAVKCECPEPLQLLKWR